MKIGDTLYLVNHSKCEIIIGTYEGLNSTEDLHKIKKNAKKNGQTLLFRNCNTNNLMFKDLPTGLIINPKIADEETFWKNLLSSFNLGNNNYSIFDNKQQALDVFKTWTVPLHIRQEEASSEQTRQRYIAHIERVDVLEKMLLCNTIVN